LKQGEGIMLDVIVQFLPLAAGAIAPVMIVAAIVMLGSQGGLAKSLAFLVGRAIAYAIWGGLFVALAGKLAGSGGEGPSTASLAIRTILGGLLLILAVKSYLGEDDPDAPPPKWMAVLDKARATTLLGIGFLLSVIQLRFVLLMLAGAGSIANAQLPSVQVVISLAVLILAMIWPQLLPVVLYAVMGDRAQGMLDGLNAWLARHQRSVNVVVLGLFGLVLLGQGLTGLLA
jgi:hypothetical protein